MKRMGDALGYRCHPCTPYKRKQHGVTYVPSIDGIDPEISPEESLTLCNSTIMTVTSTASVPISNPPSTTTTVSPLITITTGKAI